MLFSSGRRVFSALAPYRPRGGESHVAVEVPGGGDGPAEDDGVEGEVSAWGIR